MSPERMGGDGAVLIEELERVRAEGPKANAAILVEGASDQRAVEALARRRHRDLTAEGTLVAPITGATNLQRFVDLLGSSGLGLSLVGLCDEAEADLFAQALDPDRFFVCMRDLEEELIRALGADKVIELMAGQGQIGRFHRFQRQPAQRHKTLEQQVWRWLGNHKIRYAPLMVDALDLDKVPEPLESVLAAV